LQNVINKIKLTGVLWQINKPIEGASESLAALQNLGKQVYLVTNNSTRAIENFYKSAQYMRLNLSSVSILILIIISGYFINIYSLLFLVINLLIMEYFCTMYIKTD